MREGETEQKRESAIERALERERAKVRKRARARKRDTHNRVKQAMKDGGLLKRLRNRLGQQRESPARGILHLPASLGRKRRQKDKHPV